MEFFVSWYHGDPHYPLYDNDCSLLISITSVGQDWTIQSLPKLPRRLLIDSGAYHLISAPRFPRFVSVSSSNGFPQTSEVLTFQQRLQSLSAKKVFERQLSMLGGEKIPTIVCALDYPILNPSMTWSEKAKCISQTIALATDLKNLIIQKGLSDYITPMAIVQGYDIDSLRFCAYELISIGFPLYGLGSLAPLKRHALIMERVLAVASIVGVEKLHIFGVSVIETAQALRRIGVHSIDSARPAKSAAYNEIIYSSPFRRFGILEPSPLEMPLKGRIPRHRRLSTPLACNCPVCVANPESILGVGKRANIRDRGAHNYYHLKRLICEEG